MFFKKGFLKKFAIFTRKHECFPVSIENFKQQLFNGATIVATSDSRHIKDRLAWCNKK